MPQYKSARRYYLHKRKWHLLADSDMATQLHAKQAAEPGTALPATFPSLTKLATALYTTVEDLDGADATELTAPVATGAGLTSREATAVLAALTPLLP